MKEKRTRKAQDSKDKKGLLIQTNLLPWIYQMICSLTRRRMKEVMVG